MEKEQLDFNIERMKREIRKGDYYSRDLQNKSVLVIPKNVIDEIRQCFEFENCDLEHEEKESALLFLFGIIRDMIEKKDYKVIDGILTNKLSNTKE